LSEAFARAASRWAVDGVPANPSGWLYVTAHRHILGRLRAEEVAGRKVPLLVVNPMTDPHENAGDDLADGLGADIGDDRLQLILLCCHPALPRESRPALALRLVMGTSTDQIARLFLVPTPTMAARITRAKKKIVAAGIPLGAPVEHELRSRLDEVCRTVYLAFTAGYTPGAGPDLLQADLAGDAVRLAALLHDLVPDAPPVRALLALLLLQHSRRDARVSGGKLVTLDEQDRDSWHRDEIAAGLGLVVGLEPDHGYAEELRLQALIAAEHARTSTAKATDWARIAAYYADLEELTGSAVVRLNRAVAVAEADGPAAGLELLAGLEEELHGNHRVAAVRADLARRAGNAELAETAYREAIELCENDVERVHLRDRLDSLTSTDR